MRDDKEHKHQKEKKNIHQKHWNLCVILILMKLLNDIFDI